MKILFTLFILLSIGLNSHAQSNDVLAKSYFLKAQENYSEGNNASALVNLDKTLKYLGSTNAKIESLYVKIMLNRKDYMAADYHLKTYFELADESRSDYIEMLNHLPEVKEKVKTFLSNIEIENLNFNDGLAKVRMRAYGREAFINKTREVVIPAKYNYGETGSFSEGLVRVNLNGWGFIDQTGKVVAPNKYRDAKDFSNGFASVKLNGKWGFIDKTGKEVTSLKYDRVWYFSESLASVKLDGKWGFIDKTGKEVIPLKYDVAGDFSEGLASVKLNEKWGFIDNTGKEVLSYKYDYAGSFSEGLAAVELNGKWGFINKTGKEVIILKYNSVRSFSEGLAAVNLNGKYGFIDKTGKEVIPFKYKDVDNDKPSIGFASVWLNGKWFNIDKTGKRID